MRGCGGAGLALSALARTNDQVSMLLVAQLVFAGGFIPVTGRPALETIAWIMPGRSGFAVITSTADLSDSSWELRRTALAAIRVHVAFRYDDGSVPRAFPATIVNWAGDLPVTVQEWSRYFADLLGADLDLHVEVFPGASIGSVGDHTKRTSITGKCTVDWREGFRAMAAHHYPDRVRQR